ncbi:hypothetical protein [Flavobacterium agrisoli]|nr:hypothetical protein [Flavobacterium agrisoli]
MLFFSLGFVKAQEAKITENIEKTYLHTDRSTYFLGEDLWYKAYNVNATNNVLIDQSKILYVELISPDAEIIFRNKTKLELGLGNGDFNLQDSLGVKPGTYQLRAYTNWNRNFGDDFVFKKEIEIIDVFQDKNDVSTVKNNAEKGTANSKLVPKQNNFSVNFFPEGGSLLESVSSTLGFKAVDRNENPVEISGEIYNSDNELITNFQSVHDGIGKLQLFPIEGKTYYAQIKSASGDFRVELPKVLKEGYTLSYRTFRGKNILSINTNEATLAQNPSAKLTLNFKSKGVSVLEISQVLTETNFSFEFPKDKLPEGIIQITLLDENNKPHCERLVYIEKENDLEVEVFADKTIYQPNEKATITVRSQSKSGEGKSASFSLSVTDTNGVEDENYESNISSYFLMESDIRGKVFHPSYYFDETNSKRLEHLDNLLLTQGWRDFVWKTMPKLDENKKYSIERGLTVSGRVKQVFADKPLVNNNLTLGLMGGKNNGVFNTTTDANGRFKFENLMISGKTNMYLNSTNEKGKFSGQIVLDSIESYPMTVRLNKTTILLEGNSNVLVENVSQKYIAFGVKPENMLKEVKVKAKKNNVNSWYGVPDYTYKVNKIEANKYNNFVDYLEQELRGIVNVTYWDIVGKDLSDSSFAVLIDGFEAVSGDQLAWVSPDEALQIDVVSGPRILALYGKGTVVSIFTSAKNGQKKKLVPVYAVKQEIEGFYAARTYYTPNPEKPNPELDKNAAFRNTIYWNPYVHPDKIGNTIVNYFNSGVETKVKIALEGITGSGIPVVKTCFYTVKK